MRREPDFTKERVWHGHTVTIRAWSDPTDLPWDGDCELEPGAEGWDVSCEVTLECGGFNFIGRDSLGSCWGDSNYPRECLEEQVIPMALDDLESELKRVADGTTVRAARLAQNAARSALLRKAS
jgi:hypothetical protein